MNTQRYPQELKMQALQQNLQHGHGVAELLYRWITGITHISAHEGYPQTFVCR